MERQRHREEERKEEGKGEEGRWRGRENNPLPPIP